MGQINEISAKIGVESHDIVERMAVVAEEMAFLAALMIKFKGHNQKEMLKHGHELLNASVMLKEWGVGIVEDYER